MDDYDMFSGASPEELQQLIGLGTLDEQGGMLDQQLQQALMLRRQPTRERSSPLGNLFEGLGGVIRAGKSSIDEGQVRGQMQDLLGQKNAGRSVFADLIRRGSGGSPPAIGGSPGPIGGSPIPISGPQGMAQGHRMTMDALQPTAAPASASALLRGRKSPMDLQELELDPSLMGW